MAIHRLELPTPVPIDDSSDFEGQLVRALAPAGQVEKWGVGEHDVTTATERNISAQTVLKVYPDGSGCVCRKLNWQTIANEVIYLIGPLPGMKKYFVDMIPPSSEDTLGLIQAIIFWVDESSKIHPFDLVVGLFERKAQLPLRFDQFSRGWLREAQIILSLLFDGMESVKDAKQILNNMTNTPWYLLDRKNEGEQVFYSPRSRMNAN